jgi:hypothetical protein
MSGDRTPRKCDRTVDWISLAKDKDKRGRITKKCGCAQIRITKGPVTDALDYKLHRKYPETIYTLSRGKTYFWNIKCWFSSYMSQFVQSRNLSACLLRLKQTHLTLSPARKQHPFPVSRTLQLQFIFVFCARHHRSPQLQEAGTAENVAKTRWRDCWQNVIKTRWRDCWQNVLKTRWRDCWQNVVKTRWRECWQNVVKTRWRDCWQNVVKTRWRDCWQNVVMTRCCSCASRNIT